MHKAEWRDYLEEFQDKNPQFTVRNLGGMACTYVSNADLSKMLAARYPGVYGDNRRKTIAIQRGFSRSFGHFRDDSLRAHRDAEVRSLLSERADRGLRDMPLSTPDNTLQDLWVPAPVVVAPNLAIAGGRHLAMDLGRNEVLHTEMAAILGYLQNEERLNLNLLTHRGDPKPHISILRSTRGLVGEQLTAAILPREITLEKPATSLLTAVGMFEDEMELNITEL